MRFLISTLALCAVFIVAPVTTNDTGAQAHTSKKSGKSYRSHRSRSKKRSHRRKRHSRRYRNDRATYVDAPLTRVYSDDRGGAVRVGFPFLGVAVDW